MNDNVVIVYNGEQVSVPREVADFLEQDRKREQYAAATIITFMNAWNNYLWPKVILQNNDSITMPMLVANLLGGYTVDYGVLMLGVFICTIPTAIIFFCFQKSFTEGITGAVK